jgi:hypothetical protein
VNTTNFVSFRIGPREVNGVQDPHVKYSYNKKKKKETQTMILNKRIKNKKRIKIMTNTNETVSPYGAAKLVNSLPR